MDNRIQGIINTLFRTEQLHLQCSVPLFERNPQTGKMTNQTSFCNIFQTDGGSYVSINPNLVLKLKYLEKYGEYRPKGYDRSTLIYINQRTINYLIAGMKQFWKLFQREDLFLYDKDGVVNEIDMTDNERILIPMDYNQIVQITPTIFDTIPRGKNSESVPTPGIAIYINTNSHMACLTVEEYRDLIACLEKVDFNQLPLLLLQNFLLIKAQGLIEDHVIGTESAMIKKVQSAALAAFRPQEEPVIEMVSQQPILKQPSSLDEL